MTTHDWFVENRVAYATRALSPGEEQAFSAHVAGCAECRVAVERIHDELAWLPMGAAPVKPRPGFAERALEAARGRPRARGAWLSPLLAAGLTAIVASGVTWRVATRGGEEAVLAHASSADSRATSAESRAVALADTLSVMRRAGRVLQASVRTDASVGSLVIFADDETHRWNVVVHGLPPAPAGERYQFWFICEDGMVRGAPIEMGGGATLFVTGMPERCARVLGAALTREPMSDGGHETPRGATLAKLML